MKTFRTILVISILNINIFTLHTYAEEPSLFSDKYIYSTLTETQQQLYQILYTNILNQQTTISLAEYEFTRDDLYTTYYALDYENPGIFWTMGGYNYRFKTKSDKITSVSPVYSRDLIEPSLVYSQVDNCIKSLMTHINSTEDQLQQVKLIHDYLVTTVTYSNTGDNIERDIDGALIFKRAQCEGYSKAFAYLCQKINIPCICVHGLYKEGSHMWNMIKLEDTWYHVDVTFDDLAVNDIAYDYFCLSDDQIQQDHTFQNPYTQPKATQSTNPYHLVGKTQYTSLDEAYNGLILDMVANYQKGHKVTQIYCSPEIMRPLCSEIKAKIYSSLAPYNIPRVKILYRFKGSILYTTFDV